MEIVDELVKANELSEQGREAIMSTFDHSVLLQFKGMEKDKHCKPIKVSGVQTTYNFLEEAHMFRTKKFEMKGEDGFQETAQRCKIASMDSKYNPVEVGDGPEVNQRGKKKKKKKK